MKLNRCPICHSCFDVMALAQDQATQQVLVRLANFDTLTGIALLGYLSLFCPAKSQLSAGRTLTLLNELEQIADGNWPRLVIAMSTTVEAKQAQKRNSQTVKQFTNHNYLLKVLDEIPNDAGSSLVPVNSIAKPAVPQQQTKTTATLTAIEARKL